jgi:hypothetical protein
MSLHIEFVFPSTMQMYWDMIQTPLLVSKKVLLLYFIDIEFEGTSSNLQVG